MATEELIRISTIAELPFAAARAYGDQVAARAKRDGTWVDTTYADVGTIVREIALGLIDCGVAPRDRVCILAKTRAEWTFTDFGISATGAVVVPIYATSSPEECAWVLRNSGATAVVCEDQQQLDKVTKVRDSLPGLRSIITMEPVDGFMSLDELRARGRSGDPAEVDRRIAAVRGEDPFTFVYTSGTTGPPKGCVLLHSNMRYVCDVSIETRVIRPRDRVYLFLPLAHVFARIVQLASYQLGATIAYFSGDAAQIVPELMEVQPTYLPSVPRIFEKLYTVATAMAGSTPEGQAMMRKAVEVGVKVRDLQYEGKPVPEELQRAFDAADEQLYSKVRAVFGGSLRQATSGAAPIAVEILEFFYACGVPVLEGYGMTETSAVQTVSTPESHRFGTVGATLPGVETKIADDGEILMKGPNIFQGYFRNDEATREVLIDGWLHSGDLGEIDEDGYLKITGRKKDIIITAGGKNLTPANLENDLKQSQWISQAVMYGDRRPYPVALITLDPEEIVKFARAEGLPEDVPSLSQHPRVRELIQGVLDGVNAKYAPVEQIKKFHILNHDFSQDAGELTPTLKLKRNVVNEKYAELFDKLY